MAAIEPIVFKLATYTHTASSYPHPSTCRCTVLCFRFMASVRELLDRPSYLNWNSFDLGTLIFWASEVRLLFLWRSHSGIAKRLYSSIYVLVHNENLGVLYNEPLVQKIITKTIRKGSEKKHRNGTRNFTEIYCAGWSVYLLNTNCMKPVPLRMWNGVPHCACMHRRPSNWPINSFDDSSEIPSVSSFYLLFHYRPS